MADGFFGLYRGSVQNINDPEKRGRLQMVVPAVLADAPSAWAEPVLPTSENVVWRVGDRVWALFEGGDVNRPVYISRMEILGDDIAGQTIPASAVSEDVLVTNELFSRQGYFGNVRADQITTGQLFAMLAVIGTGGLHIGPEGAGIDMDEVNGIVVHTPLGDIVIPVDGSPVSMANIDLTVNSLTVLGNLAIREITNEVAKGAGIVVRSKTTAPKVGPQLTSVYPSHDAPSFGVGNGFAYLPVANAYVEGNTRGQQHETDPVSSGWLSLSTVSPVTGAYAIQTVYSITTDGASPLVVSVAGGVTVMNNLIYALCTESDGDTDPTWWVYVLKYNDTAPPGTAQSQMLSVVNKFQYTNGGLFLAEKSPYRPQISNNGTDLLIAQPNVNGTLYVASLKADTGQFFAYITCRPAAGQVYTLRDDVGAFIASPADFGSMKYLIVPSNGSAALVFGDVGFTNLRDTANEFPLPPGPLTGGIWDGTRFKFKTSLQNGRVYDMSNVKNNDLSSSAVWAVQTWRADDPTDAATGTTGDFATYETKPSPASYSWSLRKRAYIQIKSNPSIPQGTGGSDDANSLSFYVARGGGSPALPLYVRVTPPAAGQTVVLLDTLPTGATPPPTLSTFPNGASGYLASEAVDTTLNPMWRFLGDGSWRLGHLKGNADGTNAQDTGWISLNSVLTSGGVNFRRIDNDIWIQVDGAVNTTSGTTLALTTEQIPVGLRPLPPTGGAYRQGGYFAGYPGNIWVDTSGIVSAVQQSGATRASVSGLLHYTVG